MGNFIISSILKNYDFYQIHSVWQQWQTLAQKNSTGLSKIIKNRKNPSILGQLHQSIEVDNLEKCLKILQFRKTCRQNSIVGIFGVYLSSQGQTNNFNLCGQLHNYSLVTQHMPFCFSDIGLIQFSNGIHILKNAFSAAKLIKQKLNITTLYDENMIFFDNQNKCKIWINEETCQNRAIHDMQVSQSQSILSIFATVQMKIKHSQNFENYLQLKSQFELNTFIQAINFVHNFQSQTLRLTNLQESHTSLEFRCKNISQISQVKTQKPKKSLSSRKKNLEKKDIHFSSIKKLYHNEDYDSNPSIKDSRHQTKILNKLKENIPQNLRYRQKDCFQNKLSVNSFLKNGDLKKQQLKKQKIKRTQIKNKFHDYHFVDYNNIFQKPQSTISTTNQQSFEIQQSSKMFRQYRCNNKINKQYQSKYRFKENYQSPRTLNVKNECSQVSLFTNTNTSQFQFSINNNIIEPKQINNCIENFNQFQNIYKGNEKLSLSRFHSRLKKNVSLPIFERSYNFA